MENYPFYDEEHKLFARTVDDFMKKECPRGYVRKCDQERRYPYELYAKIAQQGWFGILAPEKYGGLDADAIFYAIANEFIARHYFDLAIAYGLTTWGINTLLKWGNERQKNEYIPQAISGVKRLSISITEPNAGSDAAALSLSAVPDGDAYLLNGQKVFSTAADIQDNIIILAARTERREQDKRYGITIFMVDNKTPGIEFRRLPTLARRSLGTNEIFFENVQVPKENMVGELNQGWQVLVSHLEFERVSAAAACAGCAQTIVSDALKYAKERFQFGRPIGKFQVIQHMLAEMQTAVEAARLMVYRAAWMIKEKLPCAKEASMAKLFASETAFDVATKGMQVLGGYAQIPEYDMERYWRDTKQLTVGGGTSQIQKEIIAKGMGL